MKRILLAIVLLAVFAAARLPLERSLADSLRGQRLLSEPVTLDFRESLGQMSFAASLGGLRSLVASITYLQAYAEFENVNWAKVDSLFQLTTRLQPHYANYWDEAAWMQAYNAATGYLMDQKIPPMIRGKLYHDHIQRGVAILQEGLQYLPESGKLWAKLGVIYKERTFEPKKAGDCMIKGAKLGALPVYERLGAYELVKAGDPESLREAYAILKKHYDAGKKTSGLIEHLKIAEEKLGLPAERRIPDTKPQIYQGRDHLPRR
jgi:hypothetical protein